MTKATRFVFALLLLAVAGLAAWITWPQREPLYQGKPLGFWLKGFDIGYNNPDKPDFATSVEAVRQIGTNAIPSLLRLLRARDSDLKHRFIHLARKQHLIAIDYVTADRQRWAARQGFVALALAARSAVPQLVEISREESSFGDWKKYAAEILDLLKQRGDKDVNRAIASALSQKPDR